MHEAAYRALGMPHSYEKRHVTREALASSIADLRAGLFDGYNVTLPHKTSVLGLVDSIDGSARIPDCANALIREADGTIRAFNTDVPALSLELRDLAPERSDATWAETRALVVGTGGAARAALVSLALDLGVRHVTVRGRSAHAPVFEAFVAKLRREVPETEIMLEGLVAVQVVLRKAWGAGTLRAGSGF